MSHTCLNAYVCAQASGLFDALCHQGLVRLVKKGICACSWEALLLNILLRCTNPHVGLFPFNYGLSWRIPFCTERALHHKASFSLADFISLGPLSPPSKNGWGFYSKSIPLCTNIGVLVYLHSAKTQLLWFWNLKCLQYWEGCVTAGQSSGFTAKGVQHALRCGVKAAEGVKTAGGGWRPKSAQLTPPSDRSRSRG